MTQDQRFLAIGIYINSALYIAAVYWAGMIYHHETAWKLAIVTAGVCYLNYLAQVLSAPRQVVTALTALSILAGIASAIPLVTA